MSIPRDRISVATKILIFLFLKSSSAFSLSSCSKSECISLAGRPALFKLLVKSFTLFFVEQNTNT